MKNILKYFTCFLLIGFSMLYAQTTTLPVELVYFKYQIIGTNVLLSWETATEVNSYGFNVERYYNSVWDTLGFVQGNNISNSPKYYSFDDTLAQSGKNYLYRLRQINGDGSFKFSDTLIVSIVSGINKIENLVPQNFSVSPNYPNPFNPSTNIKIEIPKASEVVLSVYNSLGKLVFKNNYGEKSGGTYVISFNAEGLGSGVYYYSITAGKYMQTHKMLLIK